MDITAFQKSTQVLVGNGQQACFWTSHWLGAAPLAAAFPSLYNHSRCKNRTVAAALANDQWIRDLHHGNTSLIVVEYLQLWRQIQQAGLILDSLVSDRIQWTAGGGDRYSAKAVYRMLFQSRPSTTDDKVI
ncbi:unnamed protein product [Triticum aestivum]|uniref:Uncharacterized protein n=1 Tax=Triticum aestivum TaxID=4565 RepID=A0A7H4LFX7_WHEAT|nr:unnamed protein product [Triticum aestivum]